MDTISVKHPVDVAETLSSMDSNDRNLAFLMLPCKEKTAILPYFVASIQEELVRSMGRKELMQILNDLHPDDRTALFVGFPDDLVKDCINLLHKEQRRIALDLIGYEVDSIAILMTPYCIRVRPEWTVGMALEHIRKFGEKAETLNFVYVVDKKNKLLDDLMIGQLLMVGDETKISSLMDSNFISVKDTITIDEACRKFIKYDRAALPVISSDGILTGIVTYDDIFKRIKEKSADDIRKFGGIERLEQSYVKTPYFDLVKKRYFRLLVFFFAELIAVSIIGCFNMEVSTEVVALALFAPLVLANGRNSGSQVVNLVIQAMAVHELKLKDWRQVMRKEIYSGIVLGSILAVIGFICILIGQITGFYDFGESWLRVAFSISLSLFFAVLFGILSGSMIPFILKKARLDPAMASTPLIATWVDVIGLIVYFSIAALFMAGRLL